MEYFFWRSPDSSLHKPVCKYSESEWIKWLIYQDRKLFPSIPVISGLLHLPNNTFVPAKAIFKRKEFRPTGLIIDFQETSLIGGLTGIYEDNDRPLRPFRPHATYNPETSYGLEFIEAISNAGFDESNPTVLILMTLLHQLKVPVNPLLPQIIARHWEE